MTPTPSVESQAGLASFVWLRSPVIKRWADAQATTRVLADLVFAWSGGLPVLVDVSVVRRPGEFEAYSASLPIVAVRRRPPPRSWLARLLRFSEGDHAVVVRVNDAEELAAVLPGERIWDADFTIYPGFDQSAADLPDPNLDLQTWVSDALPRAGWALCQMTGKFDWLVIAAEPGSAKRLFDDAVRTFAAHEARCTIVEATGTMQLAIGKRVFDVR